MLVINVYIIKIITLGNLWPTRIIAGGASPYMVFKMAKTSLQRVCTTRTHESFGAFKDE